MIRQHRRTPALLVLLLLQLAAKAQIDPGVRPISHYVLAAFTQGKVLEKNGSSTTAMLNYNTLTREMVFASGEKYLAIAEPEKVDTVFIGARTFIPEEKQFYEVLVKGKYPLAVTFSSSLEEEGNNIGYGMTSTTSSSSPLRTMMKNGSAYGLKLPDGYSIKTTTAYWLKVEGKWQRVTGFNQIAKALPEKKALINETVKAKKLEFNDTGDLVTLLQLINE